MSNGTIEVDNLRLERAAHDNAVQTPVSALRLESTNWEINARVTHVGDVERAVSGRRYQRVQLSDESWTSSIWAVMFDDVIESHGRLLLESQYFKIRNARPQKGIDGALELVITARTSIRVLPRGTATTEMLAVRTLVPFERLALCPQASAVDVAGVVVALVAPASVRLADKSRLTLELSSLPPAIYGAVRVGSVLAIKRAHVSHANGTTSVLAPPDAARYTVDPPALADITAELRAVVADLGALQSIDDVEEKSLAQMRSATPLMGERTCIVRIVNIAAHDWSYNGCRATLKSDCRCEACRRGAKKLYYKLHVQVHDDAATHDALPETLTVFGNAAQQLMAGKTPAQVQQSGAAALFRALVGSRVALTLKKTARTNTLSVIDATPLD